MIQSVFTLEASWRLISSPLSRNENREKEQAHSDN